MLRKLLWNRWSRPFHLALLLAQPFLSAAALSAGTVTSVVDGSSAEWAFLPETGTPTGYFTVDPNMPPAGSGSALLLTDDSSDGIALISQELAGTPLADLTTLSYWTRTSSPPQAPALQFSVDYDDTDGDVDWQGRLVFEPSNSGVVSADTWQEWDTLAGNWWATGAPGNASCPQSTPCSWATVLATFPDAAIHGPFGQLLIKSGSGWSGTNETHTDALYAATSGGVDILYDFEATSAQVPVTKLGVNGWFSDDTRADGTATMAEVAGTNLISPALTDDPEATDAGDSGHDDDILNQIDFFLFGGPPVAPPMDEFQGAVHLRIAGGINPAKSQLSHRNDPDTTLDADGFGFGYDVLNPAFLARYSWMGDGTASVTASFKLGFRTAEAGSTGSSSRTGENAWDKLLIYEPGNGNGVVTSDGTWHTENILLSTGSWWLFDRTAGAGTIGNPMPLADMEASGVAVGGGGKTVADVWALLTDADPEEEAILTSIQFGIGSFNAGGSVYVNQLETSFYRKGMVTTFGLDPEETVVVCVPSLFDEQCDTFSSSIQTALDLEGLGPEDVVMVDSGTYMENLTIATGLHLRGPQAGISGCDRIGSEANLAGTIDVTAPDVVIDGFTITAPTAHVMVTGPSDRLTLANNRLLGGTHQVDIATVSSDVTLADNAFIGDGGPASFTRTVASSQVVAHADAAGFYAVRNCFGESLVPSLQVSGATISPSGTREPVVGDNLFTNTGGGLDALLGTVDGLELSGNRFSLLGGPGVTGRLVDSLIVHNVFEGGTGHGIQLSQSGAGVSSGTSVLLNCFHGNQGTAVDVSVTGLESSHQARFNDLVENNVGADYAGAEILDVTGNYWGAVDGPSGAGPGTGDVVSGAGLDFTPFSTQPLTYATPCNPVADLVLTKVDDIPYAKAEDGDPVVYTLTVDNLGPQDATDVLVTDVLPIGLDECTWTCTPSGNASCGTANGAGSFSELVDIPADEAVVFEIACTVVQGPGSEDRILNTATVAAGGEIDPNANNVDSEVIDFPLFADGFESGDVSMWAP